MMSQSIDGFVMFMHQLAEIAKDAVQPFFRTQLTVDEKAGPRDFDPVTAADKAVEAAMRGLITQTYPDHAILGEEMGETLAPASLSHASGDGEAATRWVIDPIDGTRAFILGLPTWGTLIWLEIDHQPRLGMMSQPFTGDRFWSNGSAPYLRTYDGVTRTLATRAAGKLADAQIAATHPDIFITADEKAAF